ncbi:MAG: glycosyltransferase [Cyanobacteria bacterium]|nr:glycosyltransferase [Cyanobacteriota bacterium]
MLTRNHGAFLQQAIDSVIEQTLFANCELLIGEDDSADQTASVAWAAAAAHPGKIWVFESVGGALGFHRNFERLSLVARGTFVAFLEGDDWWSDSSKLERQVQLLQQQPELAFCGGRTRIWAGTESAAGQENREIGPAGKGRPLTFTDLIHSYSFHFSAVLMRRTALELPAWIFGQYCLDRPLYLLAARHGDAGVIDRCMSVYRLHGGGVWSPLAPLARARRSQQLFTTFTAVFDRRYRRCFRRSLSAILWSYLAEALRGGQGQQAAVILTMAVRASPWQRLWRQPRLTAAALVRALLPIGGGVP